MELLHKWNITAPKSWKRRRESRKSPGACSPHVRAVIGVATAQPIIPLLQGNTPAALAIFLLIVSTLMRGFVIAVFCAPAPE